MPESDDSLVNRVVHLSDAAAFTELVRRHEQKVLLLQQRLNGERKQYRSMTRNTAHRLQMKPVLPT